jgi:hypothetical protein
MRNGQNKRMRGRNRRGHNPLTRVYESNGPDVKIRGTAHHIAEKYLQLARDAQTSGDPVAGEGYLQHAEHYFRLIATAQAQFAPQQHQQHNPNQPQQPYQRPDMESRDDFEDDGDDAGGPDPQGQPYPSAPPQQMQQPVQQPRPQHQNQPQQNYQGYQQQQPRNDEPRDPGLPAFITGGGGQAPGQSNGYDNEQGGDRDNRRFHRGGRNRRFHRGGRNDYDQQRGPGGGDAQAQNAPADAQPSDEFSPPKPGE